MYWQICKQAQPAHTSYSSNKSKTILNTAHIWLAGLNTLREDLLYFEMGHS